jgi:hypothetical protein
LRRSEFAKARLDLPDQLLLLKQQYETMKSLPAWEHYQGMLEGIIELCEQGILQGHRDSAGNDLTPGLRLARHFCRMIFAVPSQIELGEQFANEYVSAVTDRVPGTQEEGFQFTQEESSERANPIPVDGWEDWAD